MQTIFNTNDMNSDINIITKEFLDPNNFKVTTFKSIMHKNTHYNKFNHRIESIKKSDKTFLFKFNEDITKLSNVYRNICIFLESTKYTNIENLICSNIKKDIERDYDTEDTVLDDNTNKVCFNYNGDEMLMMLSLNNKIYDMCINDEYIVIPLNYLLFNLKNTCFLITRNNEIEIEIKLNIDIEVNPYMLFDAYNLSEYEADKMYNTTHELIINDYDFLEFNQHDDNHTRINNTCVKELKYRQTIDAIVVEPEDKNANIKVYLDDYLFIGPRDYKFIKFSRTPNLLQNGNHYLSSDEQYSFSGKYITNTKKLTIESDIKTNYKIMIKFFSVMYDNFIKVKLTDTPANSLNYSSYPLTKINETYFLEGFWTNGFFCKYYNRFFMNNECGNYWIKCKNKQNITYPYPISSKIKIPDIFMNKFEQIINDTNIIIKDKINKSQCRLCGCENGSKEYTLQKNNITFIVPEGIKHYYNDHCVHPSKEFYFFVMNY